MKNDLVDFVEYISMLVHFGLDGIVPEWANSVVCIGTFDGVHLGHQSLIHEAVDIANKKELPSILLTFDRHPLEILAPARAPKKLISLQENMQIASTLGIAVYVVLSFDETMANMSADQFYRSILVDKLRASELVVGYDFAMGKGRTGTAEWLKAKTSTTIMPPFELNAERVSSTKIREFITEGEVACATRFLGRPYSLSGVVISGLKLGRKLGYPTVNLARSSDLQLPKDGIYAGICTTPYGKYKAAISVGLRPTVCGKHRTIEAYLIDYPGESLYGRAVCLEFVEHLRDEMNFESLEKLKEQIGQDVISVRQVLLEN